METIFIFPHSLLQCWCTYSIVLSEQRPNSSCIKFFGLLSHPQHAALLSYNHPAPSPFLKLHYACVWMLPTQYELNIIKLYGAAIYHHSLEISVTTLNHAICICDLLNDLPSYIKNKYIHSQSSPFFFSQSTFF